MIGQSLGFVSSSHLAFLINSTLWKTSQSKQILAGPKYSCNSLHPLPFVPLTQPPNIWPSPPCSLCLFFLYFLFSSFRTISSTLEWWTAYSKHSSTHFSIIISWTHESFVLLLCLWRVESTTLINLCVRKGDLTVPSTTSLPLNPDHGDEFRPDNGVPNIIRDSHNIWYTIDLIEIYLSPPWRIFLFDLTHLSYNMFLLHGIWHGLFLIWLVIWN